MKKLISIAVLATLGLAAQSQASVNININPDAIGVDPLLSVGALDWTVSSALSVADNGQSITGRNARVGQQFMTYTHGKLAAFNDGNGDPLAGGHLNSTFEWTFVAGFKQAFSAVAAPAGAGTTAFDLVAGAPSFFEIWYDATPDGNNLTGKGFNDGVKILSGHFVTGSGAFTATQAANQPAGIPEIAALDQFGVNNYAGLQSITGNGSATGTIAVDWFDGAFFVNAPGSLGLDFTSQQKLAFQQTNPSACFWTGAGYLGGAGNALQGCANTIGTLNGVNGPNVQFQVDASNSFFGVVPEPGSVALLGLGLAAVGLIRRKALV